MKRVPGAGEAPVLPHDGGSSVPAGGPWWRPPRTLVERVHWLFLLVTLAGVVSTLPAMLAPPYSHWILPGLAGAALLGVHCVLGYRQGFRWWGNGAELLGLVLVGLASREASAIMSALYVMLMYRSLAGSHRAALLRTLSYVGVMELLVTVHPIADPMMRPGLLLSWFAPSILLTAFSMRALAVLLRQHTQAADRSRVLAQAGGDLLRARTEATVRQLTGQLVAALLPDRAVHCELVIGQDDGERTRDRRDDGLGADGLGVPRPPAAAHLELALHGRSSAGLDRLVVDLAEPADEEVGESLQTAAGQVALALDNVRLQQELAHRASHDLLTGLPNRAYFVEQLREAWDGPSTERNLAVIFIDLDDFKTVNDGMGHHAGDELLEAVGERLRRCCRRGDVVARMGGDEFAVLARDVSDASSAAVLGNDLVDAFAAPFSLADRMVTVRCSVSISLSSSATAPEDMIRFADLAMYVAKALGKSRYQLFLPTMPGAVSTDLEDRAALEQALERGEFVVHYQPVVEVATGTADGFEALVRWQHPERGLLPPLEFIVMAERLGILVDLERWVLHQACRDAARWATGGSGRPPLVGVNLSAVHLQHPELVAHIREALEGSGLTPTRLVVEVTEGALLDDASSAERNLGALRALGIGVALDNFGTGYSSLSYLDQLPVDTIKIDRSFITSARRPIVTAILGLAQALGMTVVAEGVETEGQVAWLRSAGCRLAQGFFYARGAPGRRARAVARRRGPAFGVHGAGRARRRRTQSVGERPGQGQGARRNAVAGSPARGEGSRAGWAHGCRARCGWAREGGGTGHSTVPLIPWSALYGVHGHRRPVGARTPGGIRRR